MSERRDQLDKALDDALASYGEAPENEGLEQRILAAVTERARRTHAMRPLAAAIGAAAIVIMACLFWWVTPKMAIQTLPAKTTMLALRKIGPPQIRTIPLPEPATVLASAAKPRRTWENPPEPKLPQFPTPSPLSSEERALVQLVAHNPKHIPRELTDFGGPIKPIEITAVEIKPLALGWYTKEKTCCDR